MSTLDSVADDGRLFQVFAAATQNARSPTVRRHVCCTARFIDEAERKRCRPGRSATCCRLSVRYICARPFRHQNVNTASLNDIRCGARSQCRRWSRGAVQAAICFSHCSWCFCFNCVFDCFWINWVDQSSWWYHPANDGSVFGVTDCRSVVFQRVISTIVEDFRRLLWLIDSHRLPFWSLLSVRHVLVGVVSW